MSFKGRQLTNVEILEIFVNSANESEYENEESDSDSDSDQLLANFVAIENPNFVAIEKSAVAGSLAAISPFLPMLLALMSPSLECKAPCHLPLRQSASNFY